MTFEEQLTRAFDTLTDRLRGEIDSHVRRASAELIAAAPYDRDPAVVQAARAELERAVAAARQEAHDAGLTAGGEAVRLEAQAELASALAAARQEAHAAGLAEGTAAGRAAALEEVEARAPQPTESAPDQPLMDAVRAIEQARSLTEILDALVGGASSDASRADVWLLRGGGLHRWRAPASGDGTSEDPATSPEHDRIIGDAARMNAVASADGAVAVPIAIGGEVVAVLVANAERRTPNDEPRTPNDERRTSNVELLTRFAARSLEALTAFKTARALTQRPEPAAAEVPAAALDEAIAEEDTSARRYARLLVSEIKLYHEEAVAEGRRDRDLATRLGGEIARARVMFEQRVPLHVRERAEYFHDELVRTLANGDASLLEIRSQN